ncbi:protein XNDC1N [Patagioenas fasciata]|uniref:protein XNDC1N n=1 Tax=Patagioenas fasciata TaxID=372321 RepID=UPI003A99F5E0
MAPVKISYIVSFSSQDPKFPVENLLREDEPRPWLCCPRDRSGQLHVELQLERASPIGYVDIGNCGCAFLQIEVGRSSWPCDQPFLTLLPSVVLMTPAQSKLGQNRCGVRMFKEADFLAPALGQKWDRLRLTGSQPFSKRGQFGLSFIRVRTPLDPPHPPQPPQHPPPPELRGGGAAEEPPAAAGARRPEPRVPQPPGTDGAVGGAEPGTETQNQHGSTRGTPGAAGWGPGRPRRARVHAG